MVMKNLSCLLKSICTVKNIKNFVSYAQLFALTIESHVVYLFGATWGIYLINPLKPNG